MRAFVSAIAASALGLAAAGQGQTVHETTVSYQLTFTEVLAGTTEPGNGNGVIEPGEGAYLRLTVLMMPALGSVVGVDPSVVASGSAMLRGIQSVFLNLVGSNSAQGSWSNLLIAEEWDLIGSPNWPGPPGGGGAVLHNLQAGQFPPNQAAVNTTNPVVDIFKGVWTPASYGPRTVTWSTTNASANPSPFSAQVIVRDGASPQVYVGTAANGYSSVNVPIVPAPGGLVLLGTGAVVTARRRRTRL